MVKTVRKVLCVILAVMMLVPLGIMSSFAASCSCQNDPFVYIRGQGPIFVTREDGTRYAPLSEDTYDVASLSKELLPLLFEAIKTDEWDEYGTALYNMVATNYQEIKINPDGTVKENTGIEFPWSESTVKSKHDKNLDNANVYFPDWRLSPMDIADDINDFIETVKRKTGHDKVNVVTSCMGSSLALAYIAKYGYESVNRLIFLTPVHNGTEYAESILTGNMKFDSDSLIRYLNTDTVTANNFGMDVIEYLILTVNTLRETFTDEMVVYIAQNLYSKVKDSTFAPLMREFYGVGGCFASVNKDFEKGIEYLYPTDELKNEYKTVIEKARDFHYNVQLKSADILKAMEADGIPVFTIAEYGFQQVPISGEESKKVGDYTLSVESQSAGATTSKITETLSADYIASRVEAGYADYISADKEIDASTCLFPERTWFIKNLNHIYPKPVNEMVSYLAFSDELATVDSNPKYPRFMVCTHDGNGKYTLTQLTSENCNTIDWTSYEKTTGESKKALDLIINFFKNLLNNFLGKIFDMVNKIKAKTH